MRRYVEPGKVKLVWQDFAWLGEESRLAAQAARCAGEQSMFWEYHDYLYQHQRGINRGQFSPANLQAFASALGLHTDAFNRCLERGADLPAIQQDLAAAREQGITATPTFVINGRRVVGAQSLSQFVTLIEAELARLGE